MVEFMSAREFKDYLDEIKQSSKFKEYYVKLVLTVEGKDLLDKKGYIEMKVRDWITRYVKKETGYTVLQYQQKIRDNIVREYKKRGYVAFEVEWYLYKHWRGGKWIVHDELYGKIRQYVGIYLDWESLKMRGYNANSGYYLAITKLDFDELDSLVKAEEILEKLSDYKTFMEGFLDNIDSSYVRKNVSFGDALVNFTRERYGVDISVEIWKD